MSATIHPETILRELSDLWVSLGKEADPGQPTGVLRACTMTLMAVVDETEDTSDVWSVMAALMPEHPSRAIVIPTESDLHGQLLVDFPVVHGIPGFIESVG